MPCLRALVATFILFLFSLAHAATAAPGHGAAKTERAMFGLGCFWKSQYVFSKVPGVIKTRVGYSGGTVKNPSYEQVCSHQTGHVEVVELDFDPSKVSYKQLLQVFFDKHDPTTLNRQGPDVGNNYRSVIFYETPQQRAQAQEYIKTLDTSHRFKRPIVTAVEPAGPFYNAEDYHQDYFVKHGQSCE